MLTTANLHCIKISADDISAKPDLAIVMIAHLFSFN